MLFKDDCTGYRTLYFLQHKSEIFDRSKEYEAFVFTQINNRIKVLRTGNGKEYLSQEFGDLLRKRGIVHEKSIPYAKHNTARIYMYRKNSSYSANTNCGGGYHHITDT